MNSDSPEATLQEPPSEAFLQAILDGIGEGFYAVDSQWRIILFNNEAGLHFRCAPASVIGKVLWDAFPGTKDTVLGHLFLETMRTRKPVSSEAASVVFHDSFLAFRLFPLGDGMGVVFREIAPLKKAEHHRDTLMNELNHRVKNLLATVQTMARQTFREAGLSAAQQASFDLRISTLSNVNQILLREQWKSADIKEIILSTLRPHFEAGRERFVIAGDSLEIQPKAAETFALALHELCTNATKYGALSVEDGRIDLSWSVQDDSFCLAWKERGGPRVATPTRQGFGTRMIEKVVAAQVGGVAKLRFDAEGVSFDLEIPADRVVQTPLNPLSIT